MFGYDFPDRVYFKKSSSGEKIYTSKLLESLWPYGASSVGDVTFESAAYIARYCVQKVTGDLAEEHYRVVTEDGVVVDRTPEFNHMSLKPGIGSRWLEKFRTDVYPRDYVVVRGVKTKPPKYYDRLFEKYDPGEFSEIVASRELDMYTLKLADPKEFWDERLGVKEQVHAARNVMLKRSFE